MARHRRLATALVSLPDAGLLTDVERGLSANRDLSRAADRIGSLQCRLARHEKMASAYARLPSAAKLSDLADAVRTVAETQVREEAKGGGSEEGPGGKGSVSTGGYRGEGYNE